MHISKAIQDATDDNTKPTFSFEFFPPKTEQGVQNLYDRMDRMHDLGPTFVDVTWGAGGRHSGLTTEMVKVAQAAFGLETCMHLTCTDMERSKVDEALDNAYATGCKNILALRGDPPRAREKWKPTEGGFMYAKDLVKYIRERHGDHFDIGVAGYPEGCDDNDDVDELVQHLKEKVDAGGTFVITQMNYDADLFIEWMNKCRAAGINVPLIPGIMPISTHAAFLRRAKWVGCKVPDEFSQKLEKVKHDDDAVRELGADLIADFCRKLLNAGVHHLHFYTMNLATATRMVLERLSLTPSEGDDPLEKPLPWRPSKGLNRRNIENVRPIFWRNRNRSYVERTRDWDEFPNGRWGDARSPAYGELDAYGIGLKGTNEHNRKLWGEPKTLGDVASLFARYMQGKVECLPWSEAAINSEADTLVQRLVKLNERAILTINSQPPVNGEKSSHPVYGWGPRNGYVFQKAYLEVLVSPELLPELVTRMDRDEEITYFAVNSHGDLRTNTSYEESGHPAADGEMLVGGANAVTWGVFPGKEIVQPTIVETVSFLAWKDEFYSLGREWAECYDENSPSRNLIMHMMDTWTLVNIVHNDFHNPNGIFPLFDDLDLTEADMNREYDAPIDTTLSPTGGMAANAAAQAAASAKEKMANGSIDAVVNGGPPPTNGLEATKALLNGHDSAIRNAAGALKN